MTNESAVPFRRIGRVGEISITNGPRRNALSVEVIELLTEAFCLADSAAQGGEIGAVVLRGEGGYFCAGLDRRDVRLWKDGAADRGAKVRELHRCLSTLSVPTVAAVEGFAIAAGAGLAFACDFIVIGSDAFISVPEIEMGMTAPMNVAWLTLRHGAAAAAEMVLGGERVGAQRLMTLGLVRSVVANGDVVRDSHELAAAIAQHGTAIVAAAREELIAARRDPAGYLRRQLGVE